MNHNYEWHVVQTVATLYCIAIIQIICPRHSTKALNNNLALASDLVANTSPTLLPIASMQRSQRVPSTTSLFIDMAHKISHCIISVLAT